jgi:hypothetical protein
LICSLSLLLDLEPQNPYPQLRCHKFENPGLLLKSKDWKVSIKWVEPQFWRRCYYFIRCIANVVCYTSLVALSSGHLLSFATKHLTSDEIFFA